MTPLAVAVERREWRPVALYLLLGVAAAAAAMPPESLEALLDILGGVERTDLDRGEGASGR